MKSLIVQCSQWDHQDIELVFDEGDLSLDVEHFAKFLAESVRSGTQYRDGKSIQFGTMLLRVCQKGNVLVIEEPDLLAVPISWRVGVAGAVRLLRLQKDIVDSVGLIDELDAPSLRSSLLVGSDLPIGFNSLVLERAQQRDSDSGWFVGSRDSTLDYSVPSNLQRVSVYQAMLNWRRIVGFLALPVGCRVELSSQVRVARHRQVLEVRSGSFLSVARI